MSQVDRSTRLARRSRRMYLVAACTLALPPALAGAAMDPSEVGTPAGDEDSTSSSRAPGVTDSSQLDGRSEVASGVVIDRSGGAVADQEVVLFLQPSAEYMGEAKVGQSFHEQVAGKARTRDDGTFSIKVDEAALTDPWFMFESVKKGSGTPRLVDFAVVTVFEDGSLLRWYFSRLYDPATGNWLDPLLVPKSDDGGASSDWYADPMELHASDAVAYVDPKASDVVFRGCVATVEGVKTPVRVDLLDLHLSSRTTATVTYGQSQGSSMGVAVNASLTYGGFSAGGTMTRTGGNAATFARTNGNFRAATGFEYQDVSWRSWGGLPGCNPQRWEVRPSNWVPGDRTYGISAISKPYSGLCASNWPSGGTYTKNSGTGRSYSAGVNLSAFGVGINLSAQSNYSSTLQVFYQMNGGVEICGNNNQNIAVAHTLSTWDMGGGK